ncbi:DUF6694 family lipoprotein [Roseateles sp. NT4]|uniref:DUF6694 family lipoprotein n=1 Tax=Roseateles sp. NT4 TaxID=3453715 RepID=UPI003EEA7D71
MPATLTTQLNELAHMKKLVFALSLAALLAGCSDPKLDASSDEAMKVSVQRVREKLPEAKRGEFDEALQLLAFSQIDIGEVMRDSSGPATVQEKVRAAVNGKTAAEVISAGTKIKEERLARERTQALAEIKELEASRLAATRAAEQLKKFEVIRSRFYQHPRAFIGGSEPVIELTVKNSTGSPVSRAYFEGTVASTGRSVPWIKDTFNYSISGGIESGEQASWKLAPNMFSEWGTAKVPDDAVFTVTVVRLDGPDGKKLYSAADFGDRERKRLAELKAKFGIN